MRSNLTHRCIFNYRYRLRGAGKLWEVSMSSMESNSDVDSDESYEDVSTINPNFLALFLALPNVFLTNS